MRRRSKSPSHAPRDRGSVLILALFVLVLLTAVSAGQFLVTQKNIHQASTVNSRDRLRRYAESGAWMALHDLRFDITGQDGAIGTTAWTSADDLGRDGAAATGDEGEGDGLPTPGEPNLTPVSVGPAADGVLVLVFAADSGWSDIKRLVATAYRGEVSSTVESYARKLLGSNGVPKVGAIFVDPGVVIDLRGNSFSISGHDTNPDGTPGPEGPLPGIATAQGATAGENAQDIIDQIDSSRYDQVIGLGTDPSVAETTQIVSLEGVYNSFRPYSTNSVSAGTHSNVTWGTSASPQITYVNGDAHLTGDGSGYGVLLVDGDLTMTGQFTFAGVVIVRGDMRQSGGGSGVHIYGSVMVASIFSLIDDPSMTFTGNADIVYSSVAVDQASSMLAELGSTYEVLYWNVLH